MKLPKISPKLFTLAALLIFLVVHSACVEPVDGCLDIEATNFNPVADDDCCCIYPQLVLGLAYRAGDEAFSPETVYTDAAGTAFQIRKVVFYLSDITLKQNNQLIRSSDSLLVLYRDMDEVLDSVYLFTNVLLINRTAFSANLGTFREGGIFTAVQLRFGLDDPLNFSAFNDYPVRHPLALQLDSMHTGSISEGYYFLKMDIFLPDTEEVINLAIKGAQNSQLYEFPVNIESKTGFDRRVNLQIDFLSWVNGVDFANMNKEQITNLVIQNTENVFRFVD